MPKKLYIIILDWELPLKHLIRLELTPDNPLYYTRYGYAALLGITLFGGLLLNGLSQTQYLLSEVQCRNLPPWLSRLSQSADPSPPRCDCVACSKVGLTKSFSIKYILDYIAQCSGTYWFVCLFCRRPWTGSWLVSHHGLAGKCGVRYVLVSGAMTWCQVP